jgi:hypothetical protein
MCTEFEERSTSGGLLNEEKGLILFHETPIYGRIWVYFGD